jgi:hypothetical protein
MKAALRKRAEVLRKKGGSIKDISRILSVSPSSVSRWCRDVSLTSAQRSRLEEKRKKAGIKALTPWILRNKNSKREDQTEQTRLGVNDVGILTDRELMLTGLGLYWGEGYKRGSQEWGFTNSDPRVIRTILTWLDRCYQINRSRIHARLTINALYESESNRLIRIWSKETGIPMSSFAPASIIRGYGNPDRSARAYKGTLRIKVRNGTSLRRRILASIEAIADQTK